MAERAGAAVRTAAAAEPVRPIVGPEPAAERLEPAARGHARRSAPSAIQSATSVARAAVTISVSPNRSALVPVDPARKRGTLAALRSTAAAFPAWLGNAAQAAARN